MLCLRRPRRECRDGSATRGFGLFVHLQKCQWGRRADASLRGRRPPLADLRIGLRCSVYEAISGCRNDEFAHAGARSPNVRRAPRMHSDDSQSHNRGCPDSERQALSGGTAQCWHTRSEREDQQGDKAS